MYVIFGSGASFHPSPSEFAAAGLIPKDISTQSGILSLSPSFGTVGSVSVPLTTPSFAVPPPAPLSSPTPASFGYAVPNKVPSPSR